MFPGIRSALFLTFLACSPMAYANAGNFPSKPIKLVVPYQPGGSTDLLAHVLGQQLTTRFGQPVVVETKPSASEQLGETYVARSAADGYTLMPSTHIGPAINPSMYDNLRYDAVNDVAPVITLAKVPTVVVVNLNVPAKSMKKLAAYLQANKGQFNYGSTGNGAPSNLAMELYKRAAKIEATHVAYKGGAPTLQ